MTATLGIIGEIVGELLGGLLSVAVAFVIGSLVWLLIRLARRARAHLDRPLEVVDPAGRTWAVRVVLAPPPLRYRISDRLLAMRTKDRAAREAAGHERDAVTRHEIAHPKHLVDLFDEGAGFIVIPLLLLTVLALVVFAAEIVVVLVLASIVYLVRSLLGRWQVEVTTPWGDHHRTAEPSLADARTQRDAVRDRLAAGLAALPGMPRTAP